MTQKLHESEVPKPEPKTEKKPVSPVLEEVLKRKKQESIPGKVERLDG